MKIKAEIVLPHIYLLTYPTQYELAMSFIRMQEFYESPKFRGKYFTLEEFMDYWASNNGKGAFNYPSVWSGFNLPGSVIREWMDVFKKVEGEVRDKENCILGEITDLMEEEKLESSTSDFYDDDWHKIYVIGVHAKSLDVEGIIDHESAHAFYRMYPEYRKICDSVLRKIESKDMKRMTKSLLGIGYCKEMIKDEIQAYSATNSAMVKHDHVGEFVGIFNHFKKNLVKENIK